MALRHLERQDFEYYAPKLRVTLVRRHKVVEVERFLFMNYVFVEVDSRWMALRNTYGIGSVLMFGDGPEEVDPRVIRNLRELEGPDGFFRSSESPGRFQPGQTLKVIGGLLEGQFCEFIQFLGANRARVMMFRSRLVVMSLTNLAAIAARGG
jgi:transcription antitermination factor NusG